MQEYSRADVRRMLGVTEQQLRGWQRQGLIPAAEAFTFSDIIALRTLQKLRDNGVPSRRIGRPRPPQSRTKDRAEEIHGTQ